MMMMMMMMMTTKNRTRIAFTLLIVLTTMSTTTQSFSSSTTMYRTTQLAATTTFEPQQQQQQRNEFELQLGRALDTLRSDYPNILHTSPNYSIYHDQLVVVDPSGVTLHGLDSYKNAFRVVHLLVDVFFDHDMLTFRMCYDTARHVIRVSWNAELCPRFFGKPQHIDGISVYEIHPQTGMIVAHKVEHLLFNNVPVRDGIQQAMTMEIKLAAMMMKQSKSITSTSTKSTNTVLPFQLSFPTMKQQQKQSYSLFSASSSNNADTDTTNNSNNNMDVDWDKYHSKNKSRVKFGLAKLTLEEFLDLEQQVKQMEVVERAKYVSSDSTAATTTTPKKSNAWMNQLFGQKNTCESNFDCTRPELCCDFGFMKKCCASGSMVGQQIPVRVIADQQLPPDEMYGRQRERR